MNQRNDVEHVEVLKDDSLERARVLADILDNRYRFPFTQYRFGIDAIVGLLPVAGDVVTTLGSLYFVWVAYQKEVNPEILAQMIFNIFVDLFGGFIPVVGDALDVTWKCNQENMRLLEQQLSDRNNPEFPES
ncbi:MAG: DUF4112 domain-containing protein [bacterium]